MNSEFEVVYLDTRSLKCPVLFVKTKQALRRLTQQQQLVVRVCDDAGIKDIQRYLDSCSYDYGLQSVSDTNVEFTIRNGIKD